VLWGRGLCDELITRSEESCRLWRVVVCDLEKQTSWMRRPRHTGGLLRRERERTNSNHEYEITLSSTKTPLPTYAYHHLLGRKSTKLKNITYRTSKRKHNG
jgi:hypothetical protein